MEGKETIETKDKGGRPPQYATPEELSQKVLDYFESVKPVVTKAKEEGEEDEIKYEEPVTVSGLAYFLGFESRQSLYDYEKNHEFSYIIKRARLRIESEYEKKLSFKHPVGSIFALKNMGWKDESNVNVNDQREKVSELFPEIEEVPNIISSDSEKTKI